MVSSLNEVLGLVGALDDTPGENTGRERFRSYLDRSVRELGAVRDYVETCLRESGPQYNRALQDLVNHTGRLMGFNVTFGRYAGVQGEIGFDGIWRTGDRAIVVEVKTTDVYAISTSTLLDYVNRLISEKEIADWDHALGLYVVGRSESEHQHLRNSITAEGRTKELRVASIDAILSLAELMEEQKLDRDETVRLLLPPSPLVDEIVDLLARVAAEAPEEAAEKTTREGPPSPPEGVAEGVNYLMTPVSDDEDETAPVTRAIEAALSNGGDPNGSPRRRFLAGAVAP